MSVATLNGALQGLETLDTSHLARYKAAVASGPQMGWAYYFPYLLVKNKPGRCAILLTEDKGSLTIFQWRSAPGEAPRLDLLFPPVPMNHGALERALERANDFNGDRSARVMRIDEGDARLIASQSSLRVRQRREQYVFAPYAYGSLRGKHLYTIRRNVTAVKRLPDVQVTPYSPAHADGCRALLTRWKKAHYAAHGTAGGTGISKRALSLAGTLSDRDLQGEVVLIDGRVSAFAFGGEIRPGLACSFERKSAMEIRGLSYFHFRSLLLSFRDFDLVNDGSDTGRAGLRQLKESFRPIAMHVEYRATQHRS